MKHSHFFVPHVIVVLKDWWDALLVFGQLETKQQMHGIKIQDFLPILFYCQNQKKYLVSRREGIICGDLVYASEKREAMPWMIFHILLQ